MLTSHELLGFMSPTLAADILTFAHATDKELYRGTLNAVADARKVRPVFLERQPKTQRHEAMLTTLQRPSMELAASTLLRGWLMKKHNAVLVDFLNGLGIAHKDGVVEDLPETMDDAKLTGAVESLLGKHPHEIVAVYLHAFNTMNETRWNNLDNLLQKDTRLQLGG
ncbi:MAG: hypothetical protein AB1705_22925 [Verrucomicrobiota bacterium]